MHQQIVIDIALQIWYVVLLWPVHIPPKDMEDNYVHYLLPPC